VTVCPDCGIDNDAAADRCVSCGAPLDNAAARALIGQQVLGVYKILDVVGKGGMSVVYKARHKMTEQLVALKILPAELAIHPDIKARFLEEAKALAKLEHPHIVRLYNFGEEGGRFVLAMQFVDGTTFERKIFAAGRLEWQEAVNVARQVLQALEYAHGRGIVHRDIKPSNILVRGDGSAMIMDFGIAKMAEGSSRLTATGQTMGTVRYMSPEQVRGQIVDHRSDLYSLGAALFEAVVGDTPFDGATHFEIMMKHLNEPAPGILGRGFDVPVDLDRVLRRALAKPPSARYQRAAELLADLDRIVGLPAPPLPADTRPLPPTPPAARSPEPAKADELAPALEPDDSRPGRGRPSQGPHSQWPRGQWMALAALVAAGSVVGLVLLRGGHGPAADPKGLTGGRTVAESPGKPAEVAPAWPEPALVPGPPVAVDQRFAAPELLRVLSPRAVDSAAIARSYVAARRRFTDWAQKTHAAAVALRPLNLVLATPGTVCAAVTRFSRSGAPDDCTAKPPRFFYAPKNATLYVLDDDRLLDLNLPEGVSQHVCAQTESLLEKGCMKNVLPPYWDEVEKR